MEQRPRITLHLERGGDITIELFCDKTPSSASKVLTAFSESYYDGLSFHTCARDEYLQFGYYDLNGYGVYAADVDEADADSDGADAELPYREGSLALITSKYPYLAKMQLAFLLTDKPIFSGGHEILFKTIGRVTDGYDHIKSISQCSVDEDLSPVVPIVVKNATIKK
ncbi:MAG: peptidylprolyl isomerase [Clostridia bacterium]|nr:peptidylprolyl isomerase [Clostridia bacterium]